MSDFYIKPGNQERGWNDPPQFSYGSQTNAGGQKRNLLNKRVPPPQLSPQGPASGSHPSPPSNSTPSTNSAPPPVTGLPPPAKGVVLSGGAADSHQSSPKIQPGPTVQLENEPNFNSVRAPLDWALMACRQTLKKQVCDDVERRLKIFEEMWRSGKLSLPVKHRMSALAQELSNKKWDKADEIHRALMVDYVNEVSQWMVGVKRLIAETRGLSPELLSVDSSSRTKPPADPVH